MGLIKLYCKLGWLIPKVLTDSSHVHGPFILQNNSTGDNNNNIILRVSRFFMLRYLILPDKQVLINVAILTGCRFSALGVWNLQIYILHWRMLVTMVLLKCLSVVMVMLKCLSDLENNIFITRCYCCSFCLLPMPSSPVVHALFYRVYFFYLCCEEKIILFVLDRALPIYPYYHLQVMSQEKSFSHVAKMMQQTIRQFFYNYITWFALQMCTRIVELA